MNFKSQRNEKLSFFPRDYHDSQILRYETLVTDDYECIQVFSLALLEIGLWLKESDESLFIFIHIHSFEGTKFMQNAVLLLAIFNSTANKTKAN